MIINITINCQKYIDDVKPDLLLLDYLRSKGCYSVKRGCDTTNCGLCTVLLDGKPVLSCGILVVRCDKSQVCTLEGLESQAKSIGTFLAGEGADQCGFCNPGLLMNTIAMARELKNPTEEEILIYLQGNLCRCSGYMGQARAIHKYLKQLGFNKHGKSACDCFDPAEETVRQQAEVNQQAKEAANQ